MKKTANLTITHPNLAKEWHPTKNGNLLPTMVSKGSEKKVWWLGACGHEWKADISNRVYINVTKLRDLCTNIIKRALS